MSPLENSSLAENTSSSPRRLGESEVAASLATALHLADVDAEADLGTINLLPAVKAMLTYRQKIEACDPNGMFDSKDGRGGWDEAKTYWVSLGYEGSWSRDWKEGRALNALAKAVRERGEDGWKMLNIARDYLEGRAQVLNFSTKKIAELRQEITTEDEKLQVGELVVLKDAGKDSPQYKITKIYGKDNNAFVTIVPVAGGASRDVFEDEVDGVNQISLDKKEGKTEDKKLEKKPEEKVEKIIEKPKDTAEAVTNLATSIDQGKHGMSIEAMKNLIDINSQCQKDVLDLKKKADTARNTANRLEAVAQEKDATSPEAQAAKKAREDADTAQKALEAAQEKARISAANLAAVSGSPEYRKALESGTQLSETPDALRMLRDVFKFLNDLLAKIPSLKDSKFLTEKIDEIDKKLAAYEWGQEKPANPKLAKEQQERWAKNEGKLKGWMASVNEAKSREDVEALRPTLDKLTTEYQYETNKKKFRAPFEAALAKFSKVSDGANEKALDTMSAAEKALLAIGAFTKLATGKSLTEAGKYQQTPFFEFDATKPAVQEGKSAYQEFSFLGTVGCVDVNTNETTTLLKSVTRVQDTQRNGVLFNGSYMSMVVFKEKLTQFFTNGRFDYQFENKATMTVVQKKESKEAPKKDVSGEIIPAVVTPISTTEKSTTASVPKTTFDNKREQERLIGREQYTIIESIDYGSLDRHIAPENAEALKQDLRALKRFQMVYGIWRDEAQRVMDGMWWGDIRADHNTIFARRAGIDSKLNGIVTRLAEGKMIPGEGKRLVDECFGLMLEAEKEKTIIGSSDITAIRAIVNGPATEGEQAKILNMMRYGGWSGNSQGVKSYLLAEITGPSGIYKDIGEAFQDGALLMAIRIGNVEGVKNSVKPALTNTMAREIIAAYDKMQKRWAKSQAEYIEKIRAAEPGLTDAQYYEKFNQAKEISMEIAIEEIFADKVVYRRTRDLADRTKNGELNVYANLSGLCDVKGRGVGDKLKPSDDNIDLLMDVTGTIALSCVTMGVGALAARGAMIAVQAGVKATRATAIAERVMTAGRTTAAAGRASGFVRSTNFAVGTVKNTAKLTAFAGSVAVEGVAFYQGTNFAHNAIVGGPGHLMDNWNDGKENLKSIAFMGVLRSFSAVANRINAAAAAEKTGTLNGLKIAAAKNTKAVLSAPGEALMWAGKQVRLDGKVTQDILKATPTVLAEAGLITGTSLALDVHFENREWADASVGEYLQALAMVMIMHQGGKLTKKGYEKVRLVIGRKGVQIEGFGKEGMNDYLAQRDARGNNNSLDSRATQKGVENARYENAVAQTKELATQENARRAEVLAARRNADVLTGKAIESIRVSGAKITINGVEKTLPEIGKYRQYTAENIRITGNDGGTYRVTSADGKTVLGESVPRDQLRDFLQNRRASVVESVTPTEIAATRIAELRSKPMQEVIPAIRQGETIRFGTLAEGKGDFVTVRRTGENTFEVTETRAGEVQPARIVENLAFSPEAGGKVHTKITGTTRTQDGTVTTYEYGNIREVI